MADIQNDNVKIQGEDYEAISTTPVRVVTELPGEHEVLYTHTNEGAIIDVSDSEGNLIASASMTTLEFLEAVVDEDIAAKLDV